MNETLLDPTTRKNRLISAARRHMTKGGFAMDIATAELACGELEKLPAWVLNLRALQAEAVKRAAAELQKLDLVSTHLGHALKAAERAGAEPLANSIRSLLNAEELSFRAAVGRQRKIGAFHTALAVDHALERGGILAADRPAMLRVCLPEAGLTKHEIATCLKRVADYRRNQRVGK